MLFTKSKAKLGNPKTIPYKEFRNSLIFGIADKVGDTENLIMGRIAQCNGPALSGTVAVPTRFHDDPSTYTGSHALGGPSFETTPTAANTFDESLTRKEADIRGSVQRSSMRGSQV